MYITKKEVNKMKLKTYEKKPFWLKATQCIMKKKGWYTVGFDTTLAKKLVNMGG